MTFFTPDIDHAEFFARGGGNFERQNVKGGYGKVRAAVLDVRNTAPEAVVIAEAKNLGVKDYFNREINAKQTANLVAQSDKSSALITRLKELGYDSAELTDVGKRAVAVFDRTLIKPVKE